MSTLSDRLAALSPEHRATLEWFQGRRGQLIGRPEPVNGVHVFNPQTGIQKPAGWKHAVSVRQTLTSAYDDHAPEVAPDGSWTYRYFQERKDPDQAASVATNRGLFACYEDDVPVAVMIQEKPKPGVQYRVWGLAKVTGFNEGYFHLQGYDQTGNLAPAFGLTDIEYAVSPARYAEVAEPFAPISMTDARKRIDAQIVARQGGPAFRAEALKRFNNRCAISDWEVPSVLEAAHIVPYLGPATNQPDNSLLLRSDLHTLFDRNHLFVDSDTLRVHLIDSLATTPYSAYSGKLIALPRGVSADAVRARLLQRASAYPLKVP